MIDFNLNEIIDLLEEASDSGIKVSYDNDSLLVEADEDKEIDAFFLDRLRENKQSLIEYFKKHKSSAQEKHFSGSIQEARINDEGPIPLSFSQDRLWFIHQLEGSVQYHVPAALRLKGKLDVAALNYALRTIVNRHEVLRTVIQLEDGHAWQRVLEKDKWELDIIDGTSGYEDAAALQTFIDELVQIPFDLFQDHMLRTHLIKLKTDEYLLVLVMHHIASDGWSTAVLVNELNELYTAAATQREPVLDDLEIQFADYAVWQRKYLAGGMLEKKLAYWKKQLEGASLLHLPTDYERPAIKSTRGALVSFHISQKLTAQLEALSQEQGATLYMTLLAAFKVLLFRYSGQEDISIGGVVAGRMRTEMERLIGFFVNTLVLRTDLSGNPDFAGLLQQVKNTLLDAYDNQEVPFEKVVEAVLGARDISKNPLFQVIFVLQNVPPTKELKMGDVVMQDERIMRTTSLFDLHWSMEQGPDGIDVEVEYYMDIFREDTIQRMVQHFLVLLQSAVDHPTQSIGTLNILPPEETHQLLVTFNDTAVPYPANKTITALFEETVAHASNAIALSFGEQQLTYRELEEQSNRIAHYLRQQGVKEGVMVPLCMERSLQLMVSILGILKAGGAYVPVDPSYPKDRIAYMLQDTGSKLVLTTSDQQALLSVEAAHASLIFVDTIADVLATMPVHPPAVTTDPESLAYVIYTSGSTGRPKGAMVIHRNVTSLARGGNFVELSAGDTLLSTGSPSFDATTIEYWGMLLNGGQLVLCPEKKLLDNQLLKREIRHRGVTKMWFTASWFNQLVDDDITIFEGLTAVMAGGEKLSEEHIRKFRAAYPATQIINGYGPTENTTFSLTWNIAEVIPDRSIPIGRPLGNRTAYILNSAMQLLPVGTPGELYVGGDGVSHGYLNQPELTAEKFVTDPFSKKPGAKLYRTGDRARWLPDGTVAYLGRMDDQIKLRGYRIEPGEIERALNNLEAVAASCVVVKEQQTGEKRLVSYYVPDQQAVLRTEQELYLQQVSTWKELYETAYSKADEVKDLDEEFNITGWNDSFTGGALLPENMRAWLDDITSVILATNPRNVLEIGAGTGLIYFQLVGHIDKYIGTDFSHVSTRQLQQHINKGLRNYPETTLNICAAHEVTLEEGEIIDTVILNSIVQYFPGAQYMSDVLDNAISLLKGKGHLIIGDVRDVRLLPSFKRRLQLDKLQSKTSLREFEWNVDQEVWKEEELCFSPAYFFQLQSLYPGITHVEIQWKQGDYINELTLYRYTVVLSFDIEKPVLQPQWQSWNDIADKSNLLSLLSAGHSTIALQQVPNPRLWKERLLEQALSDRTINQVGELSEYILTPDNDTQAVNELLAAAKAAGYHARFLLNEDPFKINLLLEQTPFNGFVESPYSNTVDYTNGIKTNIPLFPDICEVLEKDVRVQLQQRLPEYMVPSAFIALQLLPLTSNGKVDRKFLSAWEDIQRKRLINYVAPTNETEQRLADIWQHLLGMDRVGIQDNFFELGGHSLLATRVVSAVRKELDVELSVKDFFIYPTIALLAGCLQQQEKGSYLPPVVAGARPANIPLSFSQERLWFIDQLQGTLPYHMPVIMRLQGKLDIEGLEYAIRNIVNGHEVLRTVIAPKDGVAWQHIMDKDQWQLTIVPPSAELWDEARLQPFITDLADAPFDLTRDHMLRAHLLVLSENVHVLVLNIHHIACDGWSISILVKELVELYRAYAEKRSPILEQPEIQYADYALWQRNSFDGAILDQKMAYWRQQLSDVTPLDLPGDYTRPAVQQFNGAISWFDIDPELTKQLQQLSKDQGVTLFMTLLTAFNVLLQRYSGQDDICVGSPVSGRTQLETEGLIGFFLNTIALRTNLSNNPSFISLLKQVKNTTLDAYEHQQVPFEKIVEQLVKDRDMSRSSLFQTMFILQNTPPVPELLLGDLRLTYEELEHKTTLFDITVSLEEQEDGIRGYAEYCTDLFTAGRMKQMMQHFVQLLRSIVSAPATHINTLRITTASEDEQLLAAFNHHVADYPRDKTIIDLFNKQVLLTPDAVAVVAEGTQLTYRELQEKTNQLGHYLRKKGVREDSLVPVCLERSAEMIIAILGIQKAGGAYVPIDPEYPEDRIRFMLTDIQATILLTDTASAGKLTAVADIVSLVLPDAQWDIISQESVLPVETALTPHHLAYMIYTSGSTGKPKGVMNEHGGIVNRLLWTQEYFKLDASDAVLQKTTFCFDVSVWELFWPLIAGAKLVFAKPGGHKEAGYLREVIAAHHITTIHFVPSMLDAFLDDIPANTGASLRRVLCSGEALMPQQVVRFYEKFETTDLYNLYGPTEAAIDVTCWHAPRGLPATGLVSIGTPVANTPLYILDKGGNLAPAGIPGELYIGGIQVARGYLNRPELNEKMFIHHPLHSLTGGKLYRTGDVCRWLPDGTLEYLGRIDDQVKIRGFRIELGEIENVLRQYPQVKEAVVLTKTGPDGNKALIGYIVPDASFKRGEMIAYLRGRLPEYMIPSFFSEINKIPLTANGKADRKALLSLHTDLAPQREYVAPRNEMEQILVDVWQELLQLPRVGVYDNFFELGGHSLLSMRMVAALRNKIAVEATVRSIFLYPVIDQLAAFLQGEARQILLPEVKAVKRPARIPLSFSQERLWFIDQLEGSVQYHVPAVLRLRGALDIAALSTALRSVVNRHEVLRTVIRQNDGRGYQYIMEPDKWTLHITDHPAYKGDIAALHAFIKTVTDAPFDLSTDHMLRADLVVQGANEHILIITTHHIASDAWSTGILVKELMAFYIAATTGGKAQLDEMNIQYADYAIWQRTYITGEILDKQLAYWKDNLSGITPLNLPLDYNRPPVISTKGGALGFQLPAELTAQLHQFSRQEGVSLFMTLFTAFNVMLYRYSGQEDICVGSPIAGRTQQEIEGLIGFFINMLALRVDLRDDPTFRTLLQQVKQTTLNAFEHQEVPFEKIVDQVVVDNDRSHRPVFQVVFGLQNNLNQPDLKFGDIVLSEETVTHTSAKYDLVFSMDEDEDGLNGTVVYCADLFKEATVVRMIGHFQQLLQAAVTSPAQRIALLQLLTPAEEQQLLSVKGIHEKEYTKQITFVDLFEAQANRSPDATAVVFENESLTYRELNERANCLAHYLRGRRVRAGSLVPVCMERSLDMMVSIMGILKAGGAYVPVEPDFPEERIRFMLEDTNASNIITLSRYADRLNADPADVILLDEDWNDIKVNGKDNIPGITRADQPVYVIYTSGSTGQPKGVIVTHSNLTDYISGLTNTLPLKDCRSFGLMSSMATDLGNTVIFAALANGGALHIFSKDAVQDTDILYSYLDKHPIDCIKIVPSHWRALCLPDRLLVPEKLLIFGGEALEAAVVTSIYATGTACTVVNHYGPTETTIGKLLHIVDRAATYGESIPVGKPFSATQVYVLSNELQLCPVGVPGALYIGGEGVAKGYLNNDALTATKFIADPFAPDSNTRLYSTGDMVKYLPDGNILFMGRVDDQVKIRGYRIELGEIERALNSCATVKQSVVIVKKDQLDNKRLVAYVVAEEDVDREEILQQLTAQLPDYMVPSLLMVLDYFPLLANGKVDKKALPDPDGQTLQTDSYVAPRNEVERTLAGIWETLLGVERVGINDNFFALGGDSIITIQVVSRVRRSGYELQVGDLFDYQTIAMLYAVMSARKGAVTALSADQEVQTGSGGLLPVQQWYFEKEGKTPSHFNQSMLLTLDKRIHSSTLSAAVMQLVQYHDSLRFKYTYTAGGWEQAYSNTEALLNVVDLQNEPLQELPGMLVTYGNSYQRSIDVTKGNCVSAVLFLTPAGDTHNRLLLAVHHLAVDGVSWRILLEDLERLLDGLHRNEQVSLGSKSSSYKQWYEALVKYGQSDRLLKQADYWSGMVQQYRPLPVDNAYDGVLRIKDMDSYQVKLDASLTQKLLQEVPTAYRTEINDVLLNTLALALHGWANGDVLIGLEGHGREDIDKGTDVGNTVGWFTSLYPVLLPGNTLGDTGTLLRNIKEQLRQIPDKGIGFGVLKYINKLAELQGNDPWDITFNYLGQFDAVTSGGKWFALTDEAAGAEAGDDYTVRRKIAVNGMVTGGELVLDWGYSTKHYNSATITALAQKYIAALETIILDTVAQAAKQPLLTPSDYGLSGLVSNTELDRFLDTPLPGDTTRRQEITAMYRLSGLQEGMLFHGLYDNAVDAYTEQFTYLLHQTDIKAFIATWQHLLQQHTILRSAFYHDAFHVPVQCVYRNIQLPVTILDYRHLNEVEQEAAWIAHEAEVLQQGIDFTAPPLMRMSLLQLQDDTYRMVWTYHHLLLDGWSMPVLFEELLRTYESLAAGKQPEAVATDHYEEYIRYLERRDKEEAGAYWRGYLSGISNGTLLPFISSTDRTKAKGQYKTLPVVLDAAKTRSIAAYAQRQRLTVNTLMQGVWAYLLYRYTGNDQVAYGAIVSGRPDDMPGIERKVGMYINTLPVHIAVTPEQPVTDWLRDIQSAQVQSRKYQYTPLRESQRYAGIAGDLFDTLMVYENYPVDEETLSFPWKLQIEQLHVEEHTNYPLSIAIGVGEEITILLQHNTALLSPAYITQISEHFIQVLEYITRYPAAKTSDIVLLNTEERERIAVTFNTPDIPQTTTGKSAIDLFKDRVAIAPQATALVFETQALTYQQLDQRSDQLALYLVEKGVQKETLVPVCLERSPEMVIAILGILKAGGGYLPIDPSYPAARISYLLEDSRATMMISSEEVVARLDIPAHIDLIKTDTHHTAIAEQPAIALNTTPAPGDLAYVIYTSGSTGHPKGVMIEHKGLVNLALNMEAVLPLKPATRVLQFSAFGFDASCFEIFSTLLSGGCLVIPHKEDLLSAEKFGEMVRQHQVELLLLPPSYQHTIREELGTIKTIISGGEALNREDTRYFQSKGIRVFNAYGPTENSVITSITDQPIQGDTVVIGKPLANVQVYILDQQGELAPVGVAGEICAGGTGVARGYLYRPALTAEKFIPDHFSGEPGARLYRTGDLGRWLPDGSIEYLGRIDDQVKIRGYRIEPGEIENALLQSGFVSQAVVLVKADDNGHKRLVAYVVPQGTFDKEQILAALKDKLPPYMVPALLVSLEKIPVTANGKVDKAALPEPYTLPSNTRAILNGEVEQTLAVIWEELLGIKNIGRNDNFFELGGDSIITIQVVGRAKRFGYNLTPKDLFVHQTIAGLAASLAARKEKVIVSEQGILTGNSGLTPIQQWYLEDDSIAKLFFQQLFVGIDKQISAAALTTAVQQLLVRHDALRFTYTRTGDSWQQYYGNDTGDLQVVDLREMNIADYTTALATYSDQYQASLQPEEGILVRAVLFLTPAAEAANRLLIIVHHLAVDGVSWQIMQDDLEVMLDNLQQQVPVTPAHKTSSYREWQQALVNYGQRKQLLQQREYWQHIVQQYQPLKVDKSYNGALTGNDMDTHQLHLNAHFTQLLLQEVPRAYHTEINDVLLAALSAALHAWNGSGVVVGLEGHGREDIAANIDISNTVGWFTSLYPVWLNNSTDTTADVLLKEVKEQLRQLPAKGIGYGVLKYINKEEGLQGKEPWDITFNYLGQVDAARRSSKWFSGAPEAAGTDTTVTDVKVRHKIAVNGSVDNGELVLNWTYSTHHYNAGTIEELAGNYLAQLEQLITHAVSQASLQPVFTPSDYGLGELVTNTELDQFLDTPYASGGTRRDHITGLYRLSSLQEGMLFHGLYDGNTGVYMQQLCSTLDAPDIAVLKDSWQHLLQHRSVLRSSFFANVFRIPVQCVHEQVRIPFEELDYRQLSGAEQEQAWTDYETADLVKGFDFNTPPLMRIALIRLTDERYRMVWTFHHLLLDGWSGSVVIEELLQTYDLLLAGKKPAAVEEEKYEDYIRYLERRDQEEEQLYWKGYLGAAGSGTLLPFISATAERTKGKGTYEVQEMQLTGAKAKQLLSYAQQHRITVNTVIQGVWAYLLYRYTGQQQVTYGVTVSGRPDDLPGVEKRVGMYINTLPFHTTINREQGISEWLQQIQQQQVQSREHQYTSLNDMQRWMEIPGDLFDNFLAFENYPVSDLLNTHEWKLQMDNIEMRDHANYPLGIAAVVGESVAVRFKFNTALLERIYITRLREHFQQVLEFIVGHPAAKTSDIILLTKQEREQIAVDFNAAPADYSTAGKTIISQFKERVTVAPEDIALVFEEQLLTYQELDIRSNQLAHYLSSKGVQQEMLVPVCLERSPEMIIAILGILKAGGAYLPIDPSYPAARITYLLEDSRATLLISSHSLAGELDIPEHIQMIRTDADRRVISQQPTTAPAITPAPHHLAYVIYTSGSTGNPKGVMIEHKSVVNLAFSQAASLRLIPGMRTLQFAAFGFDASCYEIFNTLLSGGSLVLPRKEDLLSADKFGDMVRSQQVALVVLPPSYQHTIREELGTIKTIVSAGEPLNREDAKYFQSKGIRVINAYGPTENTVCTSLTDDPLRGDTIVIGSPIGQVQVYILDQHGELCPVGITGEICAGGEGVARGYLYRPELTAEKFIPDHFGGKADARLYKTGDLGRWLPDGSIEYLGRIDDQVKIRGYRIELGEIENALEQFEGVSQAVVVAKGTTDNKSLIAYILPDGTFDRQAISEYLEGKLPDYMVPSLFIKIDKIPVTPNGKVDRKALPDPDAGTLSENAYVAPRNETEEVLAEIWQQLLEIDQVGIHDDFFALGGHSLLSIRLIAAIRKKLGKEIALTNIFDAPTIAGLAATLSAADTGEQAVAAGAQHIIPLNKSNSETTVFIIPGQDGLSDGYDEVAKVLSDTAAVYGIQMPGVFEGERPLYSIAAIAAQNIRWIKEQQPQGPYRFIAHSFGGYVLYEMTKQLEAAGETVAFAAILDADAHPGQIDVLNGGAMTYQDIFFQAVVEVLEENNVITNTPPTWVTELKPLVQPMEVTAVVPFIAGYLKGKMSEEKQAHVDFIMRLTDIKVSNIEVLNSYKVEGQTKADLHIVKAVISKSIDPSNGLGWAPHGKTVKVFTAPGDHHAMLTQENAVVLGQYLSEQLSAQ